MTPNTFKTYGGGQALSTQLKRGCRSLRQSIQQSVWVDAETSRKLQEVGNVQPKLPTLKFRDIGLRAPSRFGKVVLGHARVYTGAFHKFAEPRIERRIKGIAHPLSAFVASTD